MSNPCDFFILIGNGGEYVSNQVRKCKKRPTIVVERVYLGGKPMKQMFQQIAAEQIRKNLNQNEGKIGAE